MWDVAFLILYVFMIIWAAVFGAVLAHYQIERWENEARKKHD